MATITFFKSPEEFRRWLEKNHDTVTELWLGYYKKHSARRGITYKQALDEALCFGWIDGLVKTIDGESYKQRYTPRKKKSIWSNVNIKRVGELIALGRMMPAGMKAFEARIANRSGIYMYENRPRELEESHEKTFKADKKAWDFFQSQPPGYRRKVIWWVVSAKKEETRARRLELLMRDCEQGKRMAGLD